MTSIGLRLFGTSHDFASILAKPVKGAALREARSGALSRQLDPEGDGLARRNNFLPAVRPLRILLAEDNLFDQRVAQLMLAKLGHILDIVSHGRAAVDAVTTVAYDVVLMEVQMPDMDGLEATRRIRAQLPAEQQPYIIAMTANAMVEDRDACAAAGMESYLSKPARVHELEKLLTRVNATLPQSAGDTARSHTTSPQSPPLVATEPIPAVDESVLADLKEQIDDHDGSLLSELAGSYIVEASRYLDQLAAAVGAAEATDIRSVAHTWSSSSAVLGRMLWPHFSGRLRRRRSMHQRVSVSSSGGSATSTNVSSPSCARYRAQRHVAGTTPNTRQPGVRRRTRFGRSSCWAWSRRGVSQRPSTRVTPEQTPGFVDRVDTIAP